MPPSRPSTLAVLNALDPAQGGLASGAADDIRQNLADQGASFDLAAVRSVLEDLVLQGRVERVEMEDPEPVFTRPEVLLRAMGLLTAARKDPRSARST